MGVCPMGASAVGVGACVYFGPGAYFVLFETTKADLDYLSVLTTMQIKLSVTIDVLSPFPMCSFL